MRHLLNTYVSHLHETEMSAENMILQASGSDKKMIHAPVLRAKNLLGYVNAVCNKFNKKSLYYKNNRKEPVRVAFRNDKGGILQSFIFQLLPLAFPLLLTKWKYLRYMKQLILVITCGKFYTLFITLRNICYTWIFAKRVTG